MGENFCSHFRRLALRKRSLQLNNDNDKGTLKRCLNYWDLTFLGVGSTLGVGIYVLIGVVGHKIAGPAIVLSFAIAAFTSVMAGLCYAEFGHRVPLAGTGYLYTYVTIGELFAFLIGWLNICELSFGLASVARGMSTLIDHLSGLALSRWLTAHLPAEPVAPYFDIVAMGMILAVGLLLALGAQDSSAANNLFCCINLAVILFIVCTGVFHADVSNWQIPASEVPEGFGEGGFFPFGFNGVLKGAAICFYGFVGFESINSSGEEVKNSRNIPRAILSTLFIVFVAYSLVGLVITLMMPYYKLAEVAAMSLAFSYVGWEWAKWIITLGAVFGITTSLFGSLYPLTRVLYAMSRDGLFFHCFKRVNPKTKTPLLGLIVASILIGVMAALLNLESLVLISCIGSLSGYTIVAMCIVLLRYRSSAPPRKATSTMRQITARGDRRANSLSTKISVICLLIYFVLCIVLGVLYSYVDHTLIYSAVLHVCAVVLVAIIAMQPQREDKLSFKTPMVPFVPCLSIYLNVHLLAMIDYWAWLRCAVWLALGVITYIICIVFYKQTAGTNENVLDKPDTVERKMSPPLTIHTLIIEAPKSPVPPSRHSNNNDTEIIVEDDKIVPNAVKTEMIIQQLEIENEEKEAKIIDLLDQVIQAEEDSYGEIISLKEINETDQETLPHRKSLSELSDVGSDVSGGQVLSKYDVIAQVHREDLPKLKEEDERNDRFDNDIDIEAMTAFHESETNSRTDESGYSDTLDKPADESFDENIPNIPVPPPMPPEDYFHRPIIKFNTVPSHFIKVEYDDEDEIMEPRLSNHSNASHNDGNMRFGSDRQMKFMSKLNDIFQKTIGPSEEEVEPRQRSRSTGNVPDAELTIGPERPLFLDLKKELLSKDAIQNLRPVAPEKVVEPENEDEEEDTVLSREDLKNKLVNIFTLNGPQLVKPRLMKSNPPTPAESNQTDLSSTESISKLPKMDKNDTLGRQRAKFGEVLNSFRLSFNTDNV